MRRYTLLAEHYEPISSFDELVIYLLMLCINEDCFVIIEETA